MSLAWYLILAGVLFAIGATTVLVRRSAVIALMGVEMMLNAANLVLVTFSRINSNVDGEIMAFFVMVARRLKRRGPVDHRVHLSFPLDHEHGRSQPAEELEGRT